MWTWSQSSVSLLRVERMLVTKWAVESSTDMRLLERTEPRIERLLLFSLGLASAISGGNVALWDYRKLGGLDPEAIPSGYRFISSCSLRVWRRFRLEPIQMRKWRPFQVMNEAREGGEFESAIHTCCTPTGASETPSR